jgi:hypothetical protein
MRSDTRKSSAEANEATENPSDLMSLLVASRIDWSSSTTEIIGAFGKLLSFGDWD